jgi:hypothetical protein
MDRYQMIRLAQLVFALGLMFGAFLVGMGAGWVVWGRRRRHDEAPTIRAVPTPQPATAHVVSRDLFSPEWDEDAVADGSVVTFAPAELGAGSAGGARVST